MTGDGRDAVSAPKDEPGGRRAGTSVTGDTMTNLRIRTDFKHARARCGTTAPEGQLHVSEYDGGGFLGGTLNFVEALLRRNTNINKKTENRKWRPLVSRWRCGI